MLLHSETVYFITFLILFFQMSPYFKLIVIGFFLLLCCDLILTSSESEVKSKCHETEQHMESLKKYDEKLDKQIAVIDAYFNYYYFDHKGLNLEITDEYVSNPINVYRMIDRLSNLHYLGEKFVGHDDWDYSINEKLKKLALEEPVSSG